MNRLPALTPQPPQAQPARDVQAAQRAFFQAAVTARPPAAAPAPAQAAAPARPTAAPDPNRPLRPGSLVDIRV
jgi:hypothetical protein